MAENLSVSAGVHFGPSCRIEDVDQINLMGEQILDLISVLKGQFVNCFPPNTFSVDLDPLSPVVLPPLPNLQPTIVNAETNCKNVEPNNLICSNVSHCDGPIGGELAIERSNVQLLPPRNPANIVNGSVGANKSNFVKVHKNNRIDFNGQNGNVSPSGRFFTRGQLFNNHRPRRPFVNLRQRFRVVLGVMNIQSKNGYKYCINVPMPVVQRQDPIFRSLYKFVQWRRQYKFLPRKLLKFKKFLDRKSVV